MIIIKKYIFSILLTVFSLFFLYKVRSILLPFFLGFLIAYLFKDLVKKYEKKYSRNILSLISVIGFSLCVILIFIFIFPIVLNQ